MKRGFWIALALASCLMVARGLIAQTQVNSGADGAGQSKADGKARQPAATQPPQASPQDGANPFPENTDSVPVLPTKLTPDVPVGKFSESEGDRVSLPGDDLDPVRSPDDSAAPAIDEQQESSSSVNNLDTLLPGPGDDDTGKGKKKKADDLEGAPKETAQQDISVGKYYIDNKNWKAAFSRFQSAMVLAPEEPEVFWGLAESARHLGKFADARTYYLKVIEYDPDSKHAKEAEKVLKDPEIANAKAAPEGQGAEKPQ
ncbi:MAG TPA: tetratricopeptide repeat protein [Terracidiphilus sp.]|nr:tetratricopeptide repeat protein [Terracidiphilus sp.]